MTSDIPTTDETEIREFAIDMAKRLNCSVARAELAVNNLLARKLIEWKKPPPPPTFWQRFRRLRRGGVGLFKALDRAIQSQRRAS